MFHIKDTIFFIKEINLTEIFIINLLKNNIYIAIPKNIPINIYNLNCPLLNLNIEYITSNADNIQNSTSSRDVIKFEVLKVLLNILNISNIIPIKTPFIMNIKNK